MQPRMLVPLLAGLLSVGALPAQGTPCADVLLTVSSLDDQLRVVDPVTGITQSSITIVSPGFVISRLNGMARNPVTGVIYVMMHVGPGGRVLASLDPTTGTAISVGNTGDNFAGITFDNNGTLYGVTGDGGNNPETLYTINTANAMATPILPLGNGNDGEAIVFNPVDGFIYHASGYSGGEIFERIDLTGPTITNIPLSGFVYTETLAFTSIGDSGNFLMTDLNDELCLISHQGFVTRLATTDSPFTKGMVFVPAGNAQPYFRHYGFGCPAQNGAIAWLTGRGCPSPGQAITLQVLNAPPSAFGLLFLGFGQVSVPLPSAACPVQILPTFSGNVAFTTDAGGGVGVTLSLPGNLGPFDAFWQAGVVDGVTAVVTNPLQTHIR